MRRIRAAVTEEELSASSEAVLTHLTKIPCIQDAGTIHTYIGSLPGEMRTYGLIQWCFSHNKRVIVPVADIHTRLMTHTYLNSLEELQLTSWGGLQPAESMDVDPSIADVIIVPGVAFDRTGRRLGMGGGFYDRFLLELDCTAIGLAHRFQIVENLPVDPHDRPVDLVITPAGVITGQ